MESKVVRRNEIRLEILVGYSNFDEKEMRAVLEGKESIDDLVRDGMKICVFRKNMIGELVKVDDKKVVVKFVKNCGMYRVYGMSRVQEFRRKYVRFSFGY